MITHDTGLDLYLNKEVGRREFIASRGHYLNWKLGKLPYPHFLLAKYNVTAEEVASGLVVWGFFQGDWRTLRPAFNFITDQPIEDDYRGWLVFKVLGKEGSSRVQLAVPFKLTSYQLESCDEIDEVLKRTIKRFETNPTLLGEEGELPNE